MNYRLNQKNGDSLSLLGFGCMRFPRDRKETEKLLLTAVAEGVNFFDTAYIYGNSETVLGSILKKHDKRKEVKIATKISPALLKKQVDFDKYLEKQLARLQTDYIDYYFIHMLTDQKVWQRLVSIGIEDWIDNQKKNGKIRNIGFSYHGGKEEFIKICDAYDWEFCMIQYNYLDEHTQAGRRGLQYAVAKGLPVIIMEPLRGGMLANNLPKAAAKIFEQANQEWSPAEWSFRWLFDQPEVTCVLSGMSNISVLQENLGIVKAAGIGDFSKENQEVIENVRRAFREIANIPCTNCDYCMPCPQGVDIPTCLSCYNMITTEGVLRATAKYVMQTSIKVTPQVASLCNQCGACESKCPQKIAIRKELERTAKRFEKVIYRPALCLVRYFFQGG